MTDCATIIDLTNALRHCLTGFLDGDIPGTISGTVPMSEERGRLAQAAAARVVAGIDELEAILLHPAAARPGVYDGR